MEKKILSISREMKGILDDDYTLYDDGTILHFYDKHTYPGGQNLQENLTTDDISISIKKRLYDAASDANKGLVKDILKLN